MLSRVFQIVGHDQRRCHSKKRIAASRHDSILVVHELRDGVLEVRGRVLRSALARRTFSCIGASSRIGMTRFRTGPRSALSMYSRSARARATVACARA